MKKNRVVVVGAGMGGLAAAIELAAAGLDVVLVEQQAAPGGKMREIKVDGVGIDSGPTVFTMRRVFDELFAAAGGDFNSEVTLLKADLLARHSWGDGATLDLFGDVERSAGAIEVMSGPNDAAAYRDFARDSAEIFATLDHSFMRVEKPSPVGLTFSLGLTGIPRLLRTRPFVTLWNELGRRFADPRLRQLFGRYATYCGSSPFAAPATLMLIAHAERAGVWAVEGGMQRLAEAMAAQAERCGAELRFNSAVARIEVNNGAVAGVVLADETRIAADAVVFNGDSQALTEGLLGADVSRAVAARSGEPRSISALTWSLRTQVTGFDLAHHTVFFGDDYRDEFAALFDRQSITRKPTVYICAQDRATGDSLPDSPERLFILINAPATSLGKDAIARHADDCLEHLEAHGLQLAAADPLPTTTPQDYAGRFPGSDGAIYGWPTHGWSGSFRRGGARTKIGGLYLAGGTVHPGPGVPMAATSGRIAASILREDLKAGAIVGGH